MDLIFNYQDFEPKNICSVAVAVIGSAAIGAATTAYSSYQASKAQTAAADRAAQAQTAASNKAIDFAQTQYGTTRADLAPFREAGIRSQQELEARLPFLTSGINVELPELDVTMPEMSQEWLEKTPGYQFAKTQGLKAVQNSAATRGLGVSGAALKGAATFATGLADQTYGQQFERGLQTFDRGLQKFDRGMAKAKTQFDIENANRSNAYARLMGLVGTGTTAAGATATAGTAATTTAANAAISAGQGQAAAAIGAGNAQAAGINATGNAVAKAAGDIGGYYTYRGLYGNPAVDGRTPDNYAYG